MDQLLSLRDATQHLVCTRELRRKGLDHHAISREVKNNRLVPLRRGWYVKEGYWTSTEDGARHLLAIAAAHVDAKSAPVFSNRSAASLLGLPVWSSWLRRINGESRTALEGSLETKIVHTTTSRNSAPTASPLLLRHRINLTSNEVESHGELRRTSRNRTLFDLARTEPFGVALACADIILRKQFVRHRVVNTSGLAAWREMMLDRAKQRPGNRGSPAVRVLAQLADPLAESPLETMSRLRFLQVGIDVDLQVRVPDERGRGAYLDFRLRGQRVFGEADGKSKYTNEQLRGDRTADEIVYLEKRRQDWVSGTTEMRVVRWGAPEVETAAHFRDRLTAFNIHVPGTPTSSYGREVAEFLSSLYGAL